MKRILIVFCIAAAVFGMSKTIIAQERVVHGIITAFDSIPIINANVRVRSTREVVQTDSIGRFSVMCKPNDQLMVTAKGFYRQRVHLDEITKYAFVNLRLIPGERNVNVAVGYGHVKDRDLLASVSSLSAEDSDFSNYNNIYDVISGRFPGVMIRGNEIIIRGSTTISPGGKESALLIVDGLVVNGNTFGNISPRNIKSINVLKDSAAAIYGSRGGNGVVIVETKGGR